MFRKEKEQKELENFNITHIRRRFLQRTLKFTECVVIWVFILYVVNWAISVLLILYAIKETMNFMYLDTLITETSQTFRDVVGLAIIKFGVENIFKYNDFGGKVPSREVSNEDIIESEQENNDTEGGAVG